jgi:hypothetical protein
MNMTVAQKNHDFQALLDAAPQQGWTIKRTGRGHWQFLAPDKVTIVTGGGTYEDFRSFRNLVARLRKAGFQIPGRLRP